jgi:hypothetical protein
MIISIIMPDKSNEDIVVELIRAMIYQSYSGSRGTQTKETQTKQARLHIIHCTLQVLLNKEANLVSPRRL